MRRQKTDTGVRGDHLHRPDPRDDHALGHEAVADHLAAALRIHHARMTVDPRRGLGFDGRRQQVHRPFAEDLGERIADSGDGGDRPDPGSVD